MSISGNFSAENLAAKNQPEDGKGLRIGKA
jgi:hypothetical protein